MHDRIHNGKTQFDRHSDDITSLYQVACDPPPGGPQAGSESANRSETESQTPARESAPSASRCLAPGERGSRPLGGVAPPRARAPRLASPPGAFRRLLWLLCRGCVGGGARLGAAPRSGCAARRSPLQGLARRPPTRSPPDVFPAPDAASLRARPLCGVALRLVEQRARRPASAALRRDPSPWQLCARNRQPPKASTRSGARLNGSAARRLWRLSPLLAAPAAPPKAPPSGSLRVACGSAGCRLSALLAPLTLRFVRAMPPPCHAATRASPRRVRAAKRKRRSRQGRKTRGNVPRSRKCQCRALLLAPAMAALPGARGSWFRHNGTSERAALRLLAFAAVALPQLTQPVRLPRLAYARRRGR